jgi:hypothetical protein
MLAVVHARFEVACTRIEWLEDELVRRGARDAHLIADEVVAVTVEAKSQCEAETIVSDLLARVGATAVAADGERPLAVA